MASQHDIINAQHDSNAGAQRVLSVDKNGVQLNQATEETLQKALNKIPTYDLYITYNPDGTIATKVWKQAGTDIVVKTLTYNYTNGDLTSKILS